MRSVNVEAIIRKKAFENLHIRQLAIQKLELFLNKDSRDSQGYDTTIRPYRPVRPTLSDDRAKTFLDLLLISHCVFCLINRDIIFDKMVIKGCRE